MSDEHSTNTAVPQEQEQKQYAATPVQPYQDLYHGYPVGYDDQVRPPRTGFLRTSWYKRSGKYRPYPTSVSAGLACVATTLFALGLIIAGARHTPSAAGLVGALFFSSGIVQIITGIWAIVDNNLFGSVFLLGYAAFFMSLGGFLAPFFDIEAAYADGGLSDALGIFLAAWTVFTFLLWTATIKSTVPIFTLMMCLFLFFILYTIAVFGNHKGCKTASGVFCFLTSACAFYAFYDGISYPYSSYSSIPEAKILRMPGAWNMPDDENKIEFV